MSGGWGEDLRRLAEIPGVDLDKLQAFSDRIREKAGGAASEPMECAVCGREPMCDGVRFIESEDGWARCPNFSEFDQAQRVSRAQESAGVSARHRACTLGGYLTPTPHAAAARRSVEEYVASWSEVREGGEGLCLWGGTGTGKSHLAYAAVNALIGPGYRVQALVVRAVDTLRQLRQGYGGDISRQEESERYWTALTSVTLLMIDDLGVAKPSEWVQEQTYALLDHRYVQAMPTIVTTNERPDRLADRIGERAASRVHEMCRIVHVPGEDARKMIAEARDRRQR